MFSFLAVPAKNASDVIHPVIISLSMICPGNTYILKQASCNHTSRNDMSWKVASLKYIEKALQDQCAVDDDLSGKGLV